MKKIFTYMALAAVALLTACSDDDMALSDGVVNGIEWYADKNTITMPAIVHEENWEDNPEVYSKSSLAYTYSKSNLTFSWNVGDEIGVYPVKTAGGEEVSPANSTIQRWEIKEVQPSSTMSTGFFQTDDENISTYFNHSYIAISPYIKDDKDYRDIPIKYTGQVQSASAKIGAYKKKTEKEGEEAKYVNSEVEACRHLGAYDYLVDTERAATEDGGKMHFKMKRLSTMVRFYMKVPENIVFDSLQLYNSAKEFTLTTILDASTGQYAAEPTKKSHVISLQLNKFGFDYTTASENDDYYYSPTTKWVMICYMMMAPIDLSAAETPQCNLYLIGREPHYYANVVDYNIARGKSLSTEDFAALTKEEKMKVYTSVGAFNTAKGLTGGNALNETQFNALSTAQKMSEWTRKVYKATLVKKNLTADFLYQWSTALAEDKPITFQEITIQQWTEGPGFTNADGNGTEEW